MSVHVPRNARPPRGRATAVRAVTLVAVLAALVALPWAAQARASWLLRYVDGYDFNPNPPTHATPTYFVLHGTAPFSCPQVSARVIDSDHVALTVSPATCADTVYTSWSAAFDLGLLPSGNRELSVELTMARADSAASVETGTFAYGVVDSSYVPPPPDTTRVAGPLVSGVELDPAQPDTRHPVDVIVHGFFPFDCGQITGATVLDAGHVAATISKNDACPDTTRAYAQRFALGMLSAGMHSLDVAITIPGDTNRVTHAGIEFQVTDPNAPPPGDSLQAALSYARPNPFRAESRFSVSLEGPARVDVAVFDLGGRRVRTVYSGMLAGGTTELQWDGHAANGSPAPGGIYFYRLTLPNRVVTRRVVLLSRP